MFDPHALRQQTAAGALSRGNIGGAGVGYEGTAPTPVRSPEVMAQLENMMQAQEVLHQFIGELESRLCAVLSMIPPSPPAASVSTKERENSAPLADAMHQQVLRVRMAAERIQNLTARVEL